VGGAGLGWDNVVLWCKTLSKLFNSMRGPSYLPACQSYLSQ